MAFKVDVRYGLRTFTFGVPSELVCDWLGREKGEQAQIFKACDLRLPARTYRMDVAHAASRYLYVLYLKYFHTPCIVRPVRGDKLWSD